MVILYVNIELGCEYGFWCVGFVECVVEDYGDVCWIVWYLYVMDDDCVSGCGLDVCNDG